MPGTSTSWRLMSAARRWTTLTMASMENAKSRLIQRFYEYLEPGGYLFLGHAESVSKADVNFETHVYHDSRLYQKPAASRRALVATAQEKV